MVQTASQTAKASFTVRNTKGLHTRPASELAKLASQFQSKITLRYYKMEVNAKSLLGILMLAASRGARLHLHATGPDAEQALASLTQLAADNFHMQY